MKYSLFFALVLLSTPALAEAEAEAKEPTPAPVEPAPALMSAEEEALLLGASESLDTTGLRLYGFADLTYLGALVDRNDPARLFVRANSSFMVANLNLYMAGDLGPNFRSLAEVRFLYSPAGSSVRDSTGIRYERREVIDYGDDFQRALNPGLIEIERAWGEYRFRDWLTIRVGQFLTPYGIWNVDHGAPVTISVRRPYTVGEQLLPEKQTGLELYGYFLLDAWTLGYHATLSNGRGPIATVRDLDNDKAVGGRLFAQTRSLGVLTIGSSFYSGRYSDKEVRFATSEQGDIVARDHILRQYDEVSVAFDLKWEWKGIHIASEFIVNDNVYTGRGRPAATTGGSAGAPPSALVPDYRRMAGYGLLGYRIPTTGVMPFVFFERIDYGNSDAVQSLEVSQAGINYQLNPRVVLKANMTRAVARGVGVISVSDIDFWAYEAQAAWSF